MACCLFGVVIFACLYGLRKRVARALGKEIVENNPVLWSLHGAPAHEIKAPVSGNRPAAKQLPLVAPRFLLALVLVATVGVGAPLYITQHFEHFKTELACLSLRLNLPIDTLEACLSDGKCITSVAAQLPSVGDGEVVASKP